VARQLPINPPAVSEAVRTTMRANRASGTLPERRFHAALAGAGIHGYRLNLKGVPGRPDVAFPARKVAVFIHGCFWHHCPRCQPRLPQRHRAFWKRKFELNRERDSRKRGMLEGAGWTVLEFWECHVRKELGRCVSETKAALVARHRKRVTLVSGFMVADRRRGPRR
jgi:DNA mismatch endonuclease, patch repair protein